MSEEYYLNNLGHAVLQWVTAFVMLLGIQYSAMAQETLRLSKAINSAIANRQNIHAGKLDQLICKLQTDALYRKYWPQVSAQYTYQYNPILQTSILPIGVFNPAYPADATKSIQFGTKWSQAAGLTLNQPLIDASINWQIQEAKLQERITAASQAQTEYELAYTVAQIYIDISLQEMKIRSAIADTGRTWISYQLLQRELEQKRLLKSELNKAKINHNNTIQLYKNAVSQWIEDKVYLLFLIGSHDIENHDFAVDTVLFTNEQLTSVNAQLTVSNIPELQQLQLKGDLIDAQTKTEKAKYLPTASVKGFIGANQFTNSFNPIEVNSSFGLSYFGIDLRYPLLEESDKRKKLQQLDLQHTQYVLLKDDRAAQYYKDALVAKIRMEQVSNELKTQEENIALSIESISIFQVRVSEGQESSSNLNMEEADLQKLGANYQISKRQYWLYFLDYLKASGRLGMLWKEAVK
jgi:outer membrane protein